MAARGRGDSHRAGAARLRAGAARRVARPSARTKRRCEQRSRVAPRLESACRLDADRRRARVGAARRARDGRARGRASRVRFGRRPSSRRRRARRRAAGADAAAGRRIAVNVGSTPHAPRVGSTPPHPPRIRSAPSPRERREGWGDGSVQGWIRRMRQRAFRFAPADRSPVVLHHSRIYILPTRRGRAVIATLFLMLLTSLNYALSLGLAVTFLLGGLIASTLLHTFRNLAEIG